MPRLKLMGYTVEAAWVIALVVGLYYASKSRWAEAVLCGAVFLIGRTVDLLIARLECPDR